MAIEVFNRYENKYMVESGVFEKLQDRLSERMRLDAYNKERETYTITNLYYDTADDYLIRTSLQKPGYKEKLRLRAYGVPDMDAKVYVEIKKKVAGLVNKRRSAMRLDEAYGFLDSGILPGKQPYHNRQVLQEITYFGKIHEIYPTLFLAYDRRAYFGIEEPDLRVSFDRNIRTRRYDLALEAGDYGTPLLDDDCWLMEIKVAGSIPLWLCKLLSEYQIYPMGFSKYGREYLKRLEIEKSLSPVYNFLSERANRPQGVTVNVSL